MTSWLNDCSAETDGCCRLQPAANQPRLCWITPSALSEAMENVSKPAPMLLDMRSFSCFTVKHIESAWSLCFPTMLMKRMLKGAIKIDSLITDPELFAAIEGASMIVLYDSSSKPANVRQELLTLSEMLTARFSANGPCLRVLLGGMTNFEDKFPNLCTTNKVQSPTSITLDTSSLERKLSRQNSSGCLNEVNPVEVLPYLYLGSAKDSADVECLRRMGITAVLNITTTCPNFFESEFQYMSILVEDSPQTDLHSRLQQAIQFIDEIKEKGGRVFVHCHAGISRSATVCIAYVMQCKRMSVNEAYSFVKDRRPIISPNLSFMGQLIQYEQDLASIWATETRTLCNTTTITDVQAAMVATTSAAVSTTKSTSPKQSLVNLTSSAMQQQQQSTHFHLQTEQYAQESKMVSHLTDMLTEFRSQNQLGSNQHVRGLPPLFTEADRSFSVPCNVRNVSKRKREELRLSLDLHNPSRKSPQLSPCRIEAVNIDGSKITQSLTLSSTCT